MWKLAEGCILTISVLAYKHYAVRQEDHKLQVFEYGGRGGEAEMRL